MRKSEMSAEIEQLRESNERLVSQIKGQAREAWSSDDIPEMKKRIAKLEAQVHGMTLGVTACVSPGYCRHCGNRLSGYQRCSYCGCAIVRGYPYC